ncbi:MAG: hypothetical protein GEV03_08950 [Streptosporangiales bacterium]|nr:hypothetical protein [Streptosporangiales bacterium]
MTAAAPNEHEVEAIEDVLAAMGEVVRSDGGEVTLRSFDPVDGRIVVAYRQGANEECSDCAIDPDMLRQFIEESLRSHGLPACSVHVETAV